MVEDSHHPPAPEGAEKFKIGFETYLSPYSYRYGTPEMQKIWSQENYWLKVRDVQIAVAEAQQAAGIVSKEQVDDLKKHREELSVERILYFENQIGHDVGGSIKHFSEVALKGGEILNNGMTSEDSLSNVEIMQIQESFELIRPKVVNTLEAFGGQIDKYKDLVCMGYSHLQAAEPITMGYRFAKYTRDLLDDLEVLDMIRPLIKGKGIKGAVGTSASFMDILKETGMSAEEHERRVMEKLGLDFVSISDQTYPRKFLFLTEFVLSNISQSLHHFALDLQVLQSSFVDEVSEPRRKKQMASSAMPHKRNPINSENIDSITENLPGQAFSAWMVGAFVTLERTLRDSAGKRSWLPESFLIVDEALKRAEKVASGLVVHENSVRTNLKRFAPFCVTEIILGRLTKAGMDRNEAYDILYEHAEKAVEATRSGLPNPMKKLVLDDERITSLLGKKDVEQAFEEIFHHVGDAPQKCVDFLNKELYPAIGKKRGENYVG